MKIDFTKLLGFDTVSCELSESGLDLRDDTLGSKLGAKVGDGESTPSPRSIHVQNDTFGSRLGAKISSEPGGTTS